MANRNDHSDQKDPKTGTTRQQDQERGQGQAAAGGSGGATGGQRTRDKGTVPIKDDDPTEDQLGENS